MNEEISLAEYNKAVSGESGEKSTNVRYLGLGMAKKRLDAVILQSDVTNLLDVLKQNLYETHESDYVYLQYIHSNTTVFLYCDDKEEDRRFLRGVYGVKDKAILKNVDANSDKKIVQVELVVKQRLPDLYWNDISDTVTLYTPNQFYSEITKQQLRALVLKMLEKNKKSQSTSGTEPGPSISNIHMDTHLASSKSGTLLPNNKRAPVEATEKTHATTTKNHMMNSDSPENQKYWQMPSNWTQNPSMLNQMAMTYWPPGYYKPKPKKNKVLQSKEIQTDPDEQITKYEHQIVLLTEKISNMEADLEMKDRRVQVAERRLEELENKTSRYETDNLALKEDNTRMKEELTRVRLALFTKLHAIGNAISKENTVTHQKEKKRDNTSFNSKTISSNVNVIANGNIAMPVNDTFENITPPLPSPNYNHSGTGHLSKPQSPIPATNQNNTNITNLPNNTQYLTPSSQYIHDQHGESPPPPPPPPPHVYNTNNIKSSDVQVQPPNYPPGLSSAFQTTPISNLEIQSSNRQNNPGCELNTSYSSNNNSTALVQDEYPTTATRSNLLPLINTNQQSNGLMSNQDLSPLAFNNNTSNAAYTTKHSNSPTPIISRTQDTILPDLNSSQDNNLITSSNNNNSRYLINQTHPNYAYNDETASAKKTALYDSSTPFDPDINPNSVRYMSAQQNLISQLPRIMTDPQDCIEKDGETSVTNNSQLNMQQQSQVPVIQQRGSMSTQQQQQQQAQSQQTNEELVLYGGVETSKITNTIEVYDVLESKWIKKFDVEEKYYFLWGSSTAINTSIYLMGGVDVHRSPLNTCHKVDVMTGEWNSLQPMKIDRETSSCVSFGNNIYISGSGNVVTNEVEIFNVETNMWMDGPCLLKKRRRHEMVMLQDQGCCLLFGGMTESNATIDTIEMLDPREGRWQEFGILSLNKYFFDIITYRGNVMIIGGYSIVPHEVTADVGYYDIRNKKIVFGNKMCEGRVFSKSAVINDTLYVVGGTSGNRTPLGMERLDADTDTWVKDYPAGCTRTRAFHGLNVIKY